MKTFLVAVIDNDYNALVKRLTVNSENKGNVEKWCSEQSWSGHHYMIEYEYGHFLNNSDIKLDKDNKH